MKQKLFDKFLSFQSDNRKYETYPDLCRRIKNRKLVVVLAVAFTLYGAAAGAQQTGKSSASVSSMQALLLVARSSWTRSGKS